MSKGMIIGRRYNTKPYGAYHLSHHKPAFDVLDTRLGSGRGQDFPTAANAILELDYRSAVSGNKAALKRLLKQLKAHDMAKMRARNGFRQEIVEYENAGFERVDEAARLLGIVIDRQYTHVKRWIDFTAYHGDRHCSETIERTAPGLPGWLLKAARLRRGCPPGAYALVQTWIRNGGFEEPRYEEDDIDDWPVSDQSEYDDD